MIEAGGFVPGAGVTGPAVLLGWAGADLAEAGGVTDDFADGGAASAFRTVSGSPEKRSLSFPWMAAFMKVIQMGSAARAPVSFSPRDWRLSKPTQTPQVTEGEKPRNQASV